jgi:hypothetical protein
MKTRPDKPFIGNVEKIRSWKRALTDSEILLIYEGKEDEIIE